MRKGEKNTNKMERIINPKKSVVVLFNELPNNPSKDVADVLCQVEAVLIALKNLQFETHKLTFNGNLGELTENIKAINPTLVFNLVEEI